MKKMTFHCIGAIALAVFLTGCGSSGSNSATLSEDNLNQQIFQAKQYVLSSLPYKYDGRNYTGGQAIDLSVIQQGVVVEKNIEINSSGISDKMKIYNQAYSVVVANTVAIGGNTFHVTYQGLATKNIPTTGNATYTGAAFSSDSNTGRLTYNVDFANKTGNGTILNLGGVHGNSITLTSTPGQITNGNATGSSLGSGQYTLDFFGLNAQEIAGKVTNIGGGGNTNNDIGFVGKK